MKIKIKILIIFFFIFTSAFSQEIPKFDGWVTDNEKLFTSEQNAELNKLITDYESKTSVEIAILTVPTFESSIDDFAQKTATKWKIGKNGVDNGLLIVVSKNMHVLRAQTGYGLEGYLPDGWLKNQGDNIASKYKNKYFEGTKEYLLLCMNKIGKEYSIDHNKKLIKENKKSKKDEWVILWMLKHVPWYIWIIIIGAWFLLFCIDPGLAINILLIVLTLGKSGEVSSGGGGRFGGGGSSSKW